MSFTDKVKNKVEEALGKAIRKVGEATDNKEAAGARTGRSSAGPSQAGQGQRQGQRDRYQGRR